MNISDRVLQYLEFKGITKNKFYKKTGLSNGFLDKKPNIGADKVEIIISNYPDLSVEWLIMGTGEMLRTQAPTTQGVTTPVSRCAKCAELEMLVNTLKYTIEVQRELIDELKEQREDAGAGNASVADVG